MKNVQTQSHKSLSNFDLTSCYNILFQTKLLHNLGVNFERHLSLFLVRADLGNLDVNLWGYLDYLLQ